jgi:hypothetical protein
MQMKNNPLVIVAILALSLGCNMFSGGGNASNSAANAPQTATNSTPAAQSTPKRPTRADLAGRWGVNRDFKDHVIEFRGDGTGTITLDENGKTQAKQDFTWTFNVDTATFDIKSPVLDTKMAGVSTYSVHAKLIDDGEKLQTDFSPYTRSRGDDTWEKK